MVSWNVMLYSVIVRHQVLGNPVAPVFRDNALGTSKFCYLSTKLQSFASKKIIIYLMPKEPRLTNLCVLVKIMSYNYLLLLRLLSLKTFPITVIHLSMSTSALGLFNILCNSSFLDIISPEGIQLIPFICTHIWLLFSRCLLPSRLIDFLNIVIHFSCCIVQDLNNFAALPPQSIDP